MTGDKKEEDIGQMIVSEHKRLSVSEKKMIWLFLLYSFLIAWGSEAIIALLYQSDLLDEKLMQVFYYVVLGAGCGMAPAYAAFIVERKYMAVTWKAFWKRIFQTDNSKRSFAILALFAVIQFGACSFQEEYMGNPWYLFILFMPLMIYGGGLEEIGWQGIFQPILQKRLPFLAAAITGGVVWSIWHLPLWFIPNSSQSAYSFTAFTLFCITLGVTLAAAHKITGSIWVSVLLHAWSNTVLGGMYSLTSLYQFPNARTLIISMVQILAVTGVLYLYDRKQSFYRENG